METARNSKRSVDTRTPVEQVQDQIDELFDDVIDVEPSLKQPKRHNHRPENWLVIGEHASIYGNESAVHDFKNCFDKSLSNEQIYFKVNVWRKDIMKGKTELKKGGQGPPYGKEIDLLLLKDFDQRRDAGLSVDDFVLRKLLLVILEHFNLLTLLKENGGRYKFGHGWAVRFYKRHNISVRVCTTKMREIPTDFEQKKEVYLKVGAALIKKYNVPKSLVIGGDETNILFVNRARRTRNKKGAKRVPIIGMGNDKAQITTTIFCTEEGNILDYQMIFGGKTDRCHPSGPGVVKPDGCHWTHTESHWQSVATYKEVIENIIIPYKNAKIAELNLPFAQWTILKHDLHFTHKDKEVLNLLRLHHIAPLFVPAGCTDIMQECDTVLNKPFKCKVRDAFRNYLDDQFQKHIQSGLDPVLWEPKLTLGHLKPHISKFVQHGIAGLSTPEMKVVIQNAFANDGYFNLMRSEEWQLKAQIELDAITAAGAEAEGEAALVLVVPDETEVDVEDDIDDIIEFAINFADEEEDDEDEAD